MIVPPNMWWHQHFNTGTTPARYLAFKYEGVAVRNSQGVPKAWISARIGGDQIDYADESEAVRSKTTCRRTWISSMRPKSPTCRRSRSRRNSQRADARFRI